jgi:hypothetical protein
LSSFWNLITQIYSFSASGMQLSCSGAVCVLDALCLVVCVLAFGTSIPSHGWLISGDGKGAPGSTPFIYKPTCPEPSPQPSPFSNSHTKPVFPFPKPSQDQVPHSYRPTLWPEPLKWFQPSNAKLTQAASPDLLIPPITHQDSGHCFPLSSSCLLTVTCPFRVVLVVHLACCLQGSVNVSSLQDNQSFLYLVLLYDSPHEEILVFL